MTGCSRVLGLIREILMARYFGTTLAKSSFDVAFRIPNLFRRLFGEGALSAAFVPVFSKSLHEEGHKAASRFGGRMVSMMALVLGTLVVTGICVAAGLQAVAPSGSRAALVLPLAQIMLPYTLFICLVALLMGMLHAVGHFAVPALAPVILNGVWIGTLLLVCPHLPVEPAVRIRAVAWGVLVAGGIQLAVHVPALIRARLRPMPRGGFWRDPHVRRVMVLMAPAAAGLGIVQFNVFIDGVLALIAAPWAASALTYAERLVYLPLGLFATAMGTVLLPTFSSQAAREDHEGLRRTLGYSLSNMFLVMIPAAVGLTVLAGPVIELAYLWQGGAFDAVSARQTYWALVCYAPGLVVFGVSKALTPAFFAMQDTRTPVRIAVWMAILNFSLNVLAIVLLPVNYRHSGMAAATVFCSAMSCMLLGRLLTRRIGSPGWAGLLAVAGKALLASLVMAVVVLRVVLWMIARSSDNLLAKSGQLASVGLAMGAGILVYVLGSLLLHGKATLRNLRRRR